MEEILYTNFTGIDKLLSDMLDQNQALKKALKRSNICQLWSKIVGKPFDVKSKPYGMIGANTMVIACESAVVVQELTLRKKQLLKKYIPYVKPLNIELKDIVFDATKWS